MIRAQAWPPAIVYIRDPGDRRWAKQRGPFIAVPYAPSAAIMAHESHHVAQWWAITLAAGAALAALAVGVPAVPLAVVGVAPGVMGLCMLIPAFRFAAEARAYAAGARIAPELLDVYARALATGYDTGRSLDECRAAIIARL